MHSHRHISNNVVSFSKWSRKNYAIFSSLNKVVKISHLSVDLCQSASLKNQTGISILCLNKLFGQLEHEKDEEKTTTLEGIFQDFTILLNLSNSDTYQNYENTNKHLTIAHYPQDADNGLFYSYKYDKHRKN